MLSIVIPLVLLAHPLEIKQRIAALEERLITTQEDKAVLSLELSLAYLEDQKLDQALTTYLKSLPLIPISEEFKGRNSEHYPELLEIYLKPVEFVDLSKKSRELLSLTSQIEGDPGVDYLKAASYANLGDYESFMECFIRAYQGAPDSFLADKIQAVLYTKLYDREINPIHKERLRENVYLYAKRASQKMSRDLSLQKMVCDFAPPHQVQQEVALALGTIMEKQLEVPRGDIRYWVKRAAETDQKKLAIQFLDIARNWYSYSQSLVWAEEYLGIRKESEGYGEEATR